MEILFMRIFEKKNQIIELVRHQTLLFDQHLASKCLLDGIAPPPWLWSLSFPSAPYRLLECIDMKSNLEASNDIFQQFYSCYSYFKKGVNQALQETSYSDCLPRSNAQSARDIKKPFAGSSEKRGSLNPELFNISEYTEEVADVLQEGLIKGMMPTSVKREPLADVTENPNLLASASEAEIFAARNILESLNTEYSFTGTCNGVSRKLGPHDSSKIGQTDKAKGSNSITIGKYGMNRMNESVQARFRPFSMPQVSGKPSLRKEGPSLGGREAKWNNVVSNVSSFVPLVKQKQAAAIATGKKFNPVKALEAAEAAKRLTQEKENKCKMEKEARKAESARMEQENLKQMKLHKKIKEEESKKKVADMAMRKRQKEEEKKDKKPKRKHGMEPWKQQRENRKKLRTKKEKELKCQPVEERAKDMKASRNGAGKDNKKETEMGDGNLRNLSKTEPNPTIFSTSDSIASDSIKASIVLEACEASTEYGDNSKSYLEKPTVDNIFIYQHIPRRIL